MLGVLIVLNLPELLSQIFVDTELSDSQLRQQIETISQASGAKLMTVKSESQLSKPRAQRYIHGFSYNEQTRLIKQSIFLETYIYNNIDFSNCRHIIEIGCGVGAQIQRLLNRWPDLKITGIDISESQIERGRKYLQPYIEAGRVSLHVGHGEELPFSAQSFDGALICFVLEHADNPLNILKQLKKVIQPGSSLYCTEAFNSGLYTYPTCLAFQTYLEIFNRYQKQLNGDPDIGVKLCNLALKAGFEATTLSYIPVQFDDRNQELAERAAIIDFFAEAFLSAAPALLIQEKVTPYLIEKMKQELYLLKHNQESIFIYPFQQMKAIKY